MTNKQNKVTIYVTEEQKGWIDSQPKKFNLSARMREALQRIIDEES